LTPWFWFILRQVLCLWCFEVFLKGSPVITSGGTSNRFPCSQNMLDSLDNLFADPRTG